MVRVSLGLRLGILGLIDSWDRVAGLRLVLGVGLVICGMSVLCGI